jgi:signal transduction histidine kinase
LRADRKVRFFAVPVLVTAIVAVLSFAGWRHLIGARRDQVRNTAELAAAQSRHAVEAGLREYVVALRNLVGFWERVGPTPIEEWRANADVMIESFPALTSVAWVQPDGHRDRVAAAVGPLSPEAEPSELRPVRESRLIGPERDGAGRASFRVLLPVRGSDLGVLEARVNAERMLADVLQGWAPGYAIRVRWDDVDLFRRGEPSSDSTLGWWTIESETPGMLGATWNVVLAPTPELAAAWLPQDPHYFLAVGIVLALALGLLSHQLELSLLRTHDLAEGNRTLAASTEELRSLNENLESRVAERTEELETLAHSFSHDLKSPLGAILNFSTILVEDHRDQLDAGGLDVVNRIRRSANRATNLLDGLLRLDRARRAKLEIQDIDMDSLARQAFEQALSATADVDVELVLEPVPNTRGDRLLIGEVLTNLFDNALKFSRGCEKRRVTMRGNEVGGECVYEIADTGHGFDMQYAPKLFGVFERLHTSTELPGMGVGLALVRKIIQRHGGRVWGEGTIEGGARFTFTLPAPATSS